ncbi:uncharacterized protein KGF55_002900 [Candida pseudojiufengensis]|uniref:uncharacterized protein n=1 Tax=Candida pseudojiufengensis TaxID=497109 RepID=UPI0022240FF9|nr:uncharacterized protein KGF55_002900 [Candida pseudojiufengensis]KAI5963108.1 hypothetical protein KGF55_002900 [Candida pseudojiufengensis]
MTTTIQLQPSIQTITNIINEYEQEIQNLNLPNLITLINQGDQQKTNLLNKSPYLLKLNIQIIQQSLENQLKILNSNYKRNKNYKQLKHKIESLLIDLIDEKIYILNKLIKLYNFQNSPIIEEKIDREDEKQSQNESSVLKNRKTLKTTETESKNLEELRKRLLSSNTKSSSIEQDATTSNEYHESIQTDIINELTSLTSHLKTSALTLSSKILGDDLNIINETNENLIKNSQYFKIIENNLNNYLGNKSGNKISLWFLIKLSVFLVVVFIVMILFIGIIPRIR